MANKHAPGTHSTVIRCPNCGEDYSVTYKRCPFCDEKTVQPSRRGEDGLYDDELLDEDYDEEGGAHGGKRLAGSSRGGRRGGGYGGGGNWSPLRVVGTVISVALIVAAIWIVITVVKPLVSKGNLPDPTPPATSAVTPSPSPTAPAPTDSMPVETSGGLIPGGDVLDPVTSQPPAQPSQQIPATQTATGFTLNKSDFTINNAYPDPVKLKPTFTPAGTTGEITWSSSNSEVVSVDGTGLVSPGSKTGSATITATMAGGYKQECTVRNSVTKGGGGTDTTPASTAPSGSLSLNREDFSFSKVGETFKMKVSGTSSNPVWAIGDTSVATIGGDGTVTAVGSGSTTITCTVDGQTLKCIVRCQF